MRISTAYPPNFGDVRRAFDIAGRPGVVFTYGDTIYNPSRVDISPDLHAHEETHYIQQTSPGMSPELWWERYIDDSEFRFAQELEAYRVQYQFALDYYGRKQRRSLLDHISAALAGPMYGGLVPLNEARRLITA